MSAPTAQLADGVQIHFPADGRDSHIIELADHRLLRVGADTARFAEWLSDYPGTVDPAAVSRDLGPAWTPDAVAGVINALSASGAVRAVDAAPTAVAKPSRVKFNNAFSIQFTLVNPVRLYTPIAGFLARVIPAVTSVIGALSIAGAVLLLWMMGQADAPIYEMASIPTYLWVMALLYLTVAVHEFSHGAVLVAHGGMPRRIGMMLFYCSPAFFCDVTDAWLLAPGKRVRVAMAGIAIQCTFGLFALVGSLFAAGDLRALLGSYGALSIIYGVVNLVPFVKLDGYIAMAGWLEWPNLRADAITAYSNVWRRMLGAPAIGLKRTTGWLPWFGLGCVIFPVVLVAVLVSTVISTLLSYPSTITVVISAIALVALVGWLVVKVIRGIVDLVRAGARPGRLVAAVVAAAGLVAAVAAAPVTEQALPFGVQTGTQTRVATQQRALASSLEIGQTIKLHTGSLVVGPTVGQVTVVGAAEPCQVPVSALFALKDVDDPANAWCVPVEVTSTLTGEARHARATLPRQSLLDWAERTLVRPITLELFS